MIAMRSFAATDNEFYEHERKREKEKAQKKEQDKKNQVPGMNKPNVKEHMDGMNND